LRKSDHVKAIETYPELEQVFRRCGFEIEQVLFWNGLFQSLIENLLMKVGEAALLRVKGRRTPGKGQPARDNTEAVRSSVKVTLAGRGWTYRAMRLLTELMWLDLVLFGKWRAGPYFVLARRVEE
jgi:hypothetical protein